MVFFFTRAWIAPLKCGSRQTQDFRKRESSLFIPGKHDILIEECVFWNTRWGNGFEFGFELRTDRTHDCILRNSDFIRVEKAAALSIHKTDRALVAHVLFEDFRVEDEGPMTLV
jgi:hypothetical protein